MRDSSVLDLVTLSPNKHQTPCGAVASLAAYTLPETSAASISLHNQPFHKYANFLTNRESFVRATGSIVISRADAAMVSLIAFDVPLRLHEFGKPTVLHYMVYLCLASFMYSRSARSSGTLGLST